MRNFPFQSHDLNLNFNYDKKGENKEKKSKPQTKIDKYKKNDEITDKITSKKIKTEINKKENIERPKSTNNKHEINNKIEDIKEDPNENKLNIINNNIIKNEKDKVMFEEKEKGKETEDIIQKGKKYNYFINSINELRLPEYFYDLSFDILQNQ